MSTFNENAVKRSPAGSSTGGQFAVKDHAEAAELDLDAGGGVAEMLQSDPPDTALLTFVDYDERFSDEEADMMLSGRTFELEDSVWEAFEERRQDATVEAAREWCREHGMDYDELDYEDQDIITDSVGEHDDSTPVDDLARNDPVRLIRAPMADRDQLDPDGKLYAPLDHLPVDHPEAVERFQGRVDAVLAQLSKHGVDSSDPKVVEAAESLVEEGPAYWHEAVHLDVIWASRVQEVAPAESGRTTLDFDGASVVLLDEANGSGMDAEIPGRLQLDLGENVDGQGVDPDRAPHLDATGSGYGWDEVAGVVVSAYRPERVDRTTTGS